MVSLCNQALVQRFLLREENISDPAIPYDSESSLCFATLLA
ncbi:hypothetical protein NPIL_208591, partial [Nephila pilipes]